MRLRPLQPIRRATRATADAARRGAEFVTVGIPKRIIHSAIHRTAKEVSKHTARTRAKIHLRDIMPTDE